MSLPEERIAYLLDLYTSGKATVQEEKELMDWLQEAREDSVLQDYVQKVWNQHKTGVEVNEVDWDGMFDNIVMNDKVFSITPEHKRSQWPRFAAAAIVATIVAFGFYFIPLTKKVPEYSEKTNNKLPVNDIAPPDASKATLTLADGKVIVLDNTGNGSLATKGAANADKLNGDKLVYNVKEGIKVEYHTLAVPKGSKPIQLQLADGSLVWLNSASSITFPNVFADIDRKVTIRGEVYFEVAKSAGKKFFVSANGTTTEVLGTHFNINSYENEQAVKVTLLEGSVHVNGTILKPGQQAIIAESGVKINSDVNIDQVMAWKNGVFEFAETDIQSIMRQIERWYDVEVVFNDTIMQHFNGTIQRQVNASEVLDMLEKTGGVRFVIEGKKVVVKKY